MTRVVTTGCFDILHVGHLSLFEYAYWTLNRGGGQIIVLMDTDKRVKQLKGSERPINTYEDRAKMLRSVGIIDQVWPFSSEEEKESLISKGNFDYFLKGGDYNLETIKEKEFLDKLGIKIEFCPYKEGHSTTKIIEKMRKK